MIEFVNAKINLGLNILRKREDGYHDLETVFYPVGLYNGTPVNPEPFCDILEIHPCDSGREDEFVFIGNPVNCALESNLVFRAAAAYKNAARERGLSPGAVKVVLEKHIPDGAGLGGGSADAAFTLKVLNKMHDNIFTKPELIDLAAGLGADCPFFIENRPVLASGIGEIMTPATLDLTGYWALIIKPDIYVSTKEAFGGIRPQLPSVPISELITLPVLEWENAGLKNDFESHIFNLYPALKSIKSSIRDAGAVYAAMSGSGSSIFGIFDGEVAARDAFNFFNSAIHLSSLPYLKIFLCKL